MATLYSTFHLLIFATSLSWRSWTEAAKQKYTDQYIANKVDEVVHHLMQCHLSPALTLAVVRNGQVVLTKGYGYTSSNETKNVTSKTRFAIGSLTKAFTSTLIANWIHAQNGTITLDTPIKTFYKDFRVTDKVRSSQATFRDLLSHRVALPSYFMPLLVGFPPDVTRENLAQRLAFMPSDNVTFRDKFIYNNYMYTMAAHVVEKMTGGTTWEELLNQTLLLPLNMTGSGFIDTATDFSDTALPCAYVNGTIMDISTDLFKAVSPCGPAGSLYSNAEDMAKWINFQLANGLGPKGEPVVDPKVIAMTREPGMLFGLPIEELTLPKSPVAYIFKSYDLGWVTGNYRGYEQIFHTGGFVTHSSRLWLFPDVKAGIYVNVNGPQSGDNKSNLFGTLMYIISDLVLNEKPWVEASAVCQIMVTQNREPIVTPPSTSVRQPLANSTSTMDPSNTTAQAILYLVGNYSHKCFGRIEVSVHKQTQSLMLRYGRFGELIAEPLSSDSELSLNFSLAFVGPLSFMNPLTGLFETLTFSRNRKCQVDGLFVPLDPSASPVWFEKMKYRRDGLFRDIQFTDGHESNHQKVSIVSLIMIGFFAWALH